MSSHSTGDPGVNQSASDHSTGNTGVQSTDAEIRVGVLSPHNSKETKAILNAVQALGHNPVWIRDQNVKSTIQNATPEIAPEIDVLVNRLLLTKSHQPLEDLQLASIFEEIVPVLNSPTAVRETLHKYRSAMKLAAAGLPVPDAYFSRSPQQFEEWTKFLPDTAVHKRTIGTNGDHMDIVSETDTVNPRIDNGQSFVQEYLNGDQDRKSDIRVYVVGGRIVGAMRRIAPAGDWRTNVARGGDVEDVTNDLGQHPRQLAVQAAEALDLDMGGIDLYPVNDSWQILEVNATAGFKGLYSATGRSPAPYIAQLALNQAGTQVQDDSVHDLAGTLDDSIPDCKPRLADDEPEDSVIGYTSRVKISGADQMESVIAKADTGAKRTSIDMELAGRIGAGPITGTTEVRSGISKNSEIRSLVDVDIAVNGAWQSVTASITDRRRMNYPVLLGRDVLQNFTIDISEGVEE